MTPTTGDDLDECSCADETYAALSWPEGQASFEAEIAWERYPQLVISGCLECSEGGATGRRGRIQWAVHTESRDYSGEVSLAADQGWWSHTSGLDVGPGGGSLTIRSDVPQGCTLFLREVHVRSRERLESTRDGPTQILLISVDTLRHDVIANGRSSVTTPQLDRFAREAEVWPVHYAGASWTLASHATMLTGQPSWVHLAHREDAVINPSIPTLAERLSAHGLATGAMVFDCGWLSPERGFVRGFDEYRVERWRIERQARDVLGWIRDHREQPFFFFFHTFEPHSDFDRLPYEAPGISRDTVRELFSVKGYGCRRGRCASMMLRGINEGVVPVKQYDTPILRYLYDAGVRHTDAALGELFDALREAGVWDNLVVIVTSDHGEAFLEHGRVGHSSLHEEIIRVPLLIKWAHGARGGVENPARSSSIDLAPTLLELAGVDDAGLPGSHLHRLDPGRAVIAGDYAKAVVVGDVKGIFGGPRKYNELYNLGLDPRETDNLVRREHRRRNQLVKRLQQQVQRDRRVLDEDGATAEVRTLQLTPEEEERLRALGYVD
jgi:arylsulfatase